MDSIGRAWAATIPQAMAQPAPLAASHPATDVVAPATHVTDTIAAAEVPSLPAAPNPPWSSVGVRFLDGDGTPLGIEVDELQGDPPPLVEDAHALVGARMLPIADGRPPLATGVHARDRRIDVAADGSRTQTTTTRGANEDGGVVTTTEILRTGPGGDVRSSSTRVQRIWTEAGGLVTATARRDTNPDGDTATWHTRRTDAAGNERSVEVRRTLVDDVAVAEQRRVTMRAARVELEERSTTDLDAGVPVASWITRSARVDGRSSTGTALEVRFDAGGFATTIVGGHPSGKRDPIDAWIDEQAGPIEPGELRPGFGIVRDNGIGRPGGIAVDSPVYIGEPGVRANVDGVDVYVEGDSHVASQSLHDSIAAIRESWDGMPEQMRGAARRIMLLRGRADGDRINSVKYGKEFHSLANAGSGNMTCFLDRDPNPETTRHEYAHLTSGASGSAGADAWIAAMRSDQELGIRAQLGQAGRAVTYLTSRRPLLDDQVGATRYAQLAFSHGENENEDWAESVSMWISSHLDDGLVTVREPGGTTRTYGFEELFPARAALIQAHYAAATT